MANTINGDAMIKDKEQTGKPAELSPSGWITRFLPDEDGSAGGMSKRALDLACGGGRHSRLLLARGYQVMAVDRDLSKLGELRHAPGLTAVGTDLEADLARGTPLPFAGQTFDLVVVTNYLHRPLLPSLVAAVAPGGLLLYETFAAGNARFGRPSNPDFLLKPGELLDVVRGKLRVLAYETLEVRRPKPAALQRIAAKNGPPASNGR